MLIGARGDGARGRRRGFARGLARGQAPGEGGRVSRGCGARWPGGARVAEGPCEASCAAWRGEILWQLPYHTLSLQRALGLGAVLGAEYTVVVSVMCA